MHSFLKFIFGIKFYVYCTHSNTYSFADSLLSEKLYDIYHCCVYSEKLLMMDRRTVRNM